MLLEDRKSGKLQHLTNGHRQAGEGAGQVDAGLPDGGIDLNRMTVLDGELAHECDELHGRRGDGTHRHRLDEPAIIGCLDGDEFAGSCLDAGQEAGRQQPPHIRDGLRRNAARIRIFPGEHASDRLDRLPVGEEVILVAFSEHDERGKVGEQFQHVEGDLVLREPVGEAMASEQGG